VEMEMFYDLIFTNLEGDWAVFMHIYIWLFWGLPLSFASTVFCWWNEMPLWPSQFFVQINRIWFPFVVNINLKAPIIICCIKNSLLLYVQSRAPRSWKLSSHSRFTFCEAERWPQ
jgi:hypothetical protein